MIKVFIQKLLFSFYKELYFHILNLTMKDGILITTDMSHNYCYLKTYEDTKIMNFELYTLYFTEL